MSYKYWVIFIGLLGMFHAGVMFYNNSYQDVSWQRWYTNYGA